MKTLLFLIAILLCQFSFGQEFTDLKGNYLGQKVPNEVPEVFAPNIISGKGRLHTFPAFSNDNKEIYWMLIPPQIMTMNEKSQGWTIPVKADFSNGSNNQAPFVAHDGKIYFASAKTSGNGSLDIWYVNKSDSGYSLPINIGRKVNSSNAESMPSVSGKNTLFYAGNFEGKLYNRGIYYSRFENGEYQTPVALPEQININNKNNLDYTPFIATDESYLLFCSNRQNPSQELCHIYISYKDKNGEWGIPIDLSLKMNFHESSKFPYVSPDNKFLFFSSGDNIYWVDSEIIKVIR